MLLIMLVALVAVPIGEIWLLFAVGDQIGALATIALVVLTAMLGSAIIRWQGLGVVAQVRGALAAAGGQAAPGADVSNSLIGAAIDGVFLLVAGALLLTPGFATDAIGFSLLIPPLRQAIARYIWRRVKLSRGTSRASGGQTRAGATIDAEFHEINDPGDDEAGQRDGTSPWVLDERGPDKKSDSN